MIILMSGTGTGTYLCPTLTHGHNRSVNWLFEQELLVDAKHCRFEGMMLAQQTGNLPMESLALATATATTTTMRIGTIVDTFSPHHPSNRLSSTVSSNERPSVEPCPGS
ncbi:hypothetical protein V6N12_025558 [Hibiscus sabdariffa]|uniref:Uncharacterized protein n=1 Tax=Hibiscus sabdariffa TaxID=183260 RepID=A0ABR2CIV2_9ROSI